MPELVVPLRSPDLSVIVELVGMDELPYRTLVAIKQKKEGACGVASLCFKYYCPGHMPPNRAHSSLLCSLFSALFLSMDESIY